MWFALSEFIDNSTQSRMNYGAIIDDVLKSEGRPLTVEVTYDHQWKTLKITDNSIGMTHQDLVNALKIAQPTSDSKGRSKYGMGMKTAACWIGTEWSVTTCEWGSGEEWTATVNVADVAKGKTSIPLKMRKVSDDQHYTTIKIWKLNRSIPKRAEETIMTYLGSIYRMDIRAGRLIVLFNEKPLPLPEEMEFAKYEDGTIARHQVDVHVNGKRVHGWFGVLRTGGRKFGGFSLFQHDRQIRGYPDAWKPRSVFGGVEDEGSNTLVSQRLTGELILDGFEVSHTKDAIQFQGDEEDLLEKILVEHTLALKRFAASMRKGSAAKATWDKERLAELLREAKDEFGSSEFKDSMIGATLPPLEVIKQANQRQEESLSESDLVFEIPDVGEGIGVRVAFQGRSEYDPHLSFVPHEKGITVIINQLHPYYVAIESEERVREILFQYIYDAVAEFRVGQRLGRQEPDAVRKLKDQLLRSKITRMEVQETRHAEDELDKIKKSIGG